jgi:predicted RNase H-like nuclease
MRIIGVDLAWGHRARTGVAVIEGGRVLDSASVRGDDELDAWIGAQAPVLDPPLDVRTSPRWPRLRAMTRGVPGGAALDRAEDELDAYVCAYVGRYHLAWRGRRSLTVGDAWRGYVVTPVDAARRPRLIAAAARLGVAAG